MRLYTSHTKISADTLTPVGVFLKIRDYSVHPILFERSDNSSQKKSVSYICFDPLAEFSVHHNKITIKGSDIETNEKVINSQTDIAAELQNFIAKFEHTEFEYPFLTNGLFGYTSYNAIKYSNKIPIGASTETSIPEIYYTLYKNVLVFDHHKDELHLFSHHNNQKNADENLKKIITLLEGKQVAHHAFYTEVGEEKEISDEAYHGMVEQAISHCKRGDVFQLVLARKFKQSFKGDDFNVYRVLRNINPSPYHFYFDYGNFRLFGSSPETQLIVKDRTAHIYPIAGTVKRTGNKSNDIILSEQLSNDPKENAEHVMLVDLARNDLSKHCTDVHVNSYKQIHLYSHVIHMVSEVSGTLKENVFPYRMLLDSFPAGTLTGAPKHKAMELINQYEITRRNSYGGCIGMIGFDGSLDHAIIIRSFLSKGTALFYQGGAGIVSLSQKENEKLEVDNKMNALRHAIQIASANTNLQFSQKKSYESISL